MEKHHRTTPMRKCVGCHQMHPKHQLIRVIKNKQHEILLDLTAKQPGRGAYLCKTSSCFQLAKKKRGLERAFRCKLPTTIYDELECNLHE